MLLTTHSKLIKFSIVLVIYLFAKKGFSQMNETIEEEEAIKPLLAIAVT